MAPMRCEYEALPDDCDVEVGEIFKRVRACPIGGVTWLGWRAEPLFFGLQKLVVTCKLEDSEEDLAERVLEALKSLDVVQSAKILSMETYRGDPFAICSRLFTCVATPPSIDAVFGPQLGRAFPPASMAQQLTHSGYAVLDSFLDEDAVRAVRALVDESLASYPDFLDDGIGWRLPEPRNARDDVAVWVAPGQRPASDRVFADSLLPAFQRLQEELRSFIGLQGENETQLAWYAGTGARYMPHIDAMPDDDSKSSERKITAILYCNPDWALEHGGALRLWLPDHAGGASLDVEPRGGRLLLFLSGCIRHEVLPAYKSRCAVTSWFR